MVFKSLGDEGMYHSSDGNHWHPDTMYTFVWDLQVTFKLLFPNCTVKASQSQTLPLNPHRKLPPSQTQIALFVSTQGNASETLCHGEMYNSHAAGKIARRAIAWESTGSAAVHLRLAGIGGMEPVQSLQTLVWGTERSHLLSLSSPWNGVNKNNTAMTKFPIKSLRFVFFFFLMFSCKCPALKTPLISYTLLWLPANAGQTLIITLRLGYKCL